MLTLLILSVILLMLVVISQIASVHHLERKFHEFTSKTNEAFDNQMDLNNTIVEEVSKIQTNMSITNNALLTMLSKNEKIEQPSTSGLLPADNG